MFQFSGFPSIHYGFMYGSQVLHLRGFPIRKSADRSLFAAPRSLSQLVTSFFGSWCQGIHLMLLFAWTFCIGLLTFAVRFFELLEFLRTYFSVCSKKALAFSPFHFLLAFSRSSKLFFTLLFLKDQYFSILCPQYLFVSTLSLLFGFQWTWFSIHAPNFSNGSSIPSRVLGCRFLGWLAQVDSNHRPRAYQARALTTWAMRQ